AQEKELDVGMSEAEAVDELDVAVFAPLLERPPTARTGVEPDDRSAQIKTKRREVGGAAPAFFLGQLEDIALGSAGKTEDLGHALLVRRGALPFDVVEDAGFQPAPGGVIGRLNDAALVEHKSVLACRTRRGGQCRARLPGIEVDHAIERPRLQMHER